MITFVNMDITEATKGVIVQGCNAQGVMGSGVAKAIRDKWPSVFDGYSALCARFAGDRSVLLGMSSVYKVPERYLFVVNGITQVSFGKDGKVYANKEAIRAVLTTAGELALKHCYDDHPTVNVYLPRIGCGLGGLDWVDIYPVLVETDSYINKNSQYTVNFIVCDI